ncbi:Hemimethylated DNA-binding protein YccV like [Fragilaria crotonensis]|nr:Hemimethylated DNA-binding protein YccV like [Fragilaria crotonensis]
MNEHTNPQDQRMNFAAMSMLSSAIPWPTRSFATTSDLGSVGLALYRKLLHWCRDTDSDIPLDAFITPLFIGPPIVDAVALERLSRETDTFIWDLLPENAEWDEHGMTIPLNNSTDIRNAIRAIYRMNAATNVDDDTAQQRVGKAFETFKLLNDASGVVAKYRALRALHLDRTGVLFRVGQVVQHKKTRWRGVVTSWERTRPLPEGQLTSLTTKLYPTPEDAMGERKGDSILYKVMVDSADAKHFLSKEIDHDKHVECVLQSELDLITDGRLCRIRHDPISSPFDRYDCASNSFVPKKVMQYEYPLDVETKATAAEGCETESLDLICSGISDAMQRFAARLENRILSQTLENPSTFEIMRDLYQRMRALSWGDSFEDNKGLTATFSPSILARRQLLTLHLGTWGLFDHIRGRRVAVERIGSLRFRLGDIVQSTQHGFRGVIIGCLSEWGVDNPRDEPMYCIVPDKGDYIGKSRKDFEMECVWVRDDFLEKCPTDQAVIAVSNIDFQEPGWEKDKTNARYIAPAPLRFAYGEEGDDLETIERHCMELYNEINNLHLVQRGVTNVGDDEIQQIGAALSTDVLFQWLKLVDNFESSGTVNDAITHAWIAHPDLALRTRLDDGVYNSKRNCAHTALASARQLVLDDPKYGEAWSLMAICYFELDEYEAALEAAGKAVELIPQHYNMMYARRYSSFKGSTRHGSADARKVSQSGTVVKRCKLFVASP